jgi:hypothetical protein
MVPAGADPADRPCWVPDDELVRRDIARYDQPGANQREFPYCDSWQHDRAATQRGTSAYAS